MAKKSNKEEFIQKAKKNHGDKYDYSKTKYINSRTKVEITCKIHGSFFQRPNCHLKKDKGCNLCGIKKRAEKQTKEQDKLIEEFKKVHGDKYDYSNVVYSGGNKKIDIICKNHGIFKQNPFSHKNKRGCPKCCGKNKTTEEFINECRKIHLNKYDYSKTIYKNRKSYIEITCPIHGNFKQVAYYHLDGSGCPICSESHGEIEIRKFLTEKNVPFSPQHKFENCKNIKNLPFDFYLKEKKICIEFNGKQHYEPIEYFGGKENFIKTNKNDMIKKEYCKKNKIKLIVIKYNENIDNKLRKIFI